jgi:hypothetical protein
MRRVYLDANNTRFPQVGQGDVLLTAATTGREGTGNGEEIGDVANVRIGREGVALAYGEKEGHRHMLTPLIDGEEIEVFKQSASGATQTVTVFQTPTGGAALAHPDHGTLIIPGGVMVIVMAGQREHSPAAKEGHVSKAD